MTEAHSQSPEGRLVLRNPPATLANLAGAYVTAAVGILLLDGWHQLWYRHGRHYPFWVDFAVPLLAWVPLAFEWIRPSAVEATGAGVYLTRWGRVKYYPWTRISHFRLDKRVRWTVAYVVLWPVNEPSGAYSASPGLSTVKLPSLKRLPPKALVELLDRKQREATGRGTSRGLEA